MAEAIDPVDPWFTDVDDGTLIHFYLGRDPDDPCADPSKDAIIYEQNTVSEGCELDPGPTDSDCSPSVVFFTNKVETVDPLPDDFFFLSGSVSRFPDRLSLFLEESAVSRYGDVFTSNISKSSPVRSYITRYDFVNVEDLGISNGDPNQVFTVSGGIILLPTKGTPTVFVGGIDTGIKWTVTSDLSTAGPNDLFFEYDSSIGQVTFGNGINGAIPENGESIVLRISIRNSGGTWEYQGIVLDRKTEKNLGLVKSARDKVLYMEGDVALGDTSVITAVHSELNCIVQDYRYEGTLMMQVRVWQMALGGEATASGGSIITKNTDVDSAFAVHKHRDSTAVDGENHSGDPVTPGSLEDTSTHCAMAVDLGEVYPSLKGTVPDGGSVLVQNIGDSAGILQVIETTRLDGGAVYTPDKYETLSGVYPIVEVWEFIRFNRLEITSPCTVTVIADPQYALAFFCWPELYHEVGVEGFDSPNDFTRVKTVELPSSPLFKGNFQALFSGRSNAEINRALIAIADLSGTFVSPVKSDFNTCDHQYYDSGETVVGDASFGRFVDGSSSRHPEWATFTIEEHLDLFDEELQTHLFGSAQSPNFSCVFDAEERNIVQLADVTVHHEDVLNNQNICIGVNLIQDTIEDWRAKLVRESLKGPAASTAVTGMTTPSAQRGASFQGHLFIGGGGAFTNCAD